MMRSVNAMSMGLHPFPERMRSFFCWTEGEEHEQRESRQGDSIDQTHQ